MRPSSRWKAPSSCVTCVAIIGSILMFSVRDASAHVMPWRDGMPRQTGIGTCAKGPCLKRTDFSPTIPHVHLMASNLGSVLLCTGLKRRPSACSADVAHR